jgi:arylsulfatase
MYKYSRYVLVPLLLIFLGGCAAKSSKKPNIVYILADDLGYGDIGAYGQQKIETPNIDTLAKHGMLFTQFYAFPVCEPSRYLLLTGRNSGHAYIRNNNAWGERGDVWNYKAMEANPALEGQLPMPDSTITIAKELKKAGYKTAIIGKWGLGGPFTTGIPNNQGFDYFYGFLGQREDHTYYPGHLWENKLRVPLANNKDMSPQVKFPKDENPLDPKNYEKYSQGDYAPKFIIKAALRFIQKNRNHSFFLYFASPLPHVSLQAPQKWMQYYHKKFGNEKPFLGGSYFPVRYPRATYAAMVSTLDEHVGEIVQKLKDIGVYKNTIIIFTSDNGPTYNGGTDSPWFDSGGPFKSKKGWGKGYVHEGGIREPFIAEWPGKIKPGTKSSLISAEWDAMPTLCQIVSINPPKNIQGISYLPTLLGHPKRQEKHPFLYWEFPGYGGQQAVRMGKWKGIRMNIKKKDNLKIQLFNLKKDIQEQHDVSAQHPDVVQKIKDIMAKEHTIPKVDAFKMKLLQK